MSSEITLKDNDAAIIFNEDASFNLYIPHIDPVPGHVLTAMVIGILLKAEDKEFASLLEDKMGKLLEMVNK